MGQDLADFEKQGPWIETFTGLKFHILNPTVEEISIEDIAHALSNQCRFTGHTKRFYSVGEHCYRTSLLVTGKLIELQALLHDSSEAYLCDLARPIKYHTPIGVHYKIVEEKIQDVIFDKFRLPHGMPQEIKDADVVMLYTEKTQLMPDTPWEECNEGCGIKPSAYDGEPWRYGNKVSDMYLTGFSPIVMERIFLRRFEELTASRPATASSGPEPSPPTHQ